MLQFSLHGIFSVRFLCDVLEGGGFPFSFDILGFQEEN